MFRRWYLALVAIASRYHSESAKPAQRMDVWSHGTLPPLCGPISPAQMGTPAGDTVALTTAAIEAVSSSLAGVKGIALGWSWSTCSSNATKMRLPRYYPNTRTVEISHAGRQWNS
jgi:hypothetical protein